MSAIWSSLPVQENVSNGAAVMLVPLPGESVVTVTGPDSEKFLQGQTSTDFREVTPTASRLGCYCNLKGRASVSFRAVLWQGSYHLSVDTELLALAKSTLQKYIIFSKAQLSTPDIALFGILGAEAANFIRQQFGVCIDGTDTVIDCGDFALVRLPGDNRFLALAKAEALPGLWEKLTATAPVGSANDWRLAQIRAGESQVLAAGVAQLRFRLLMTLILGVLATNYLFSTGDYYRFFQKEDWSNPAGYVANFIEKDDLILFNSNIVQIPFEYYFKTWENLYDLQAEKHGVPVDLFDGGVLEPKMSESDIPKLISLLQGYNRVWLVYSHSSYTDPNGLIPQTLTSQMKLIQKRDFYGVQVQLYEHP